MPRTINTGNAIGAALRWIFPADEATLPYPDDASAIDVIAGANAAINNGAPSLGPLSARPSAGGQTAAGGFRSNSIPSGLTYPITLALKHVISQSPAGGEPVLGVFRWSAKFCGISYVTSPPRFQAVVRNEGAIASIDGPALPNFDGVQNLALIVTSPTQRALYINGTLYVDSSGTTVDYTAGSIYQRIGVGAAFDDTGAVIGSGSGNSAWAALFNAALTVGQLNTYFADPAGTVFLSPTDTTPPVITGPSGATGATSAINIPELITAVHTFTANETVTWDLNGGADVARFTINAGGALSFLSAPNFEAPNDVGNNNTYEVGVRARDAALNSTTQTLTVTVVNANEAPVITSNGGGATAAISVPEGTTAVTTLTATDPDAGATLTWTIVGGADAARFQITGAALSFLTAPNFDVPTDVGANNVYDVTVQVSDGTLTDTQAIAVTVTNVGGGSTFSALTDVIGESGIKYPEGTTLHWTWFPGGRPGNLTGGVDSSGTVDAAGKLLITHTLAGAGFLEVGRRVGPTTADDRVFSQFLTLA